MKIRQPQPVLSSVSLLASSVTPTAALPSAAMNDREVLSSLLESSAQMLASRNEQEALMRILAGIQRLGFDRVRLFRLTQDGQQLKGRAQIGMESDLSEVGWDITEDEYWLDLLAHPFPKICSGKPTHSERGLDKDGVAEWLCVPLLWRGEIIGQITADNKHTKAPIGPRDWHALALFGTLAAGALKEHELLDQVQKEKEERASILERLPLAAVSIDSEGRIVTFNHRAEQIFGYRAEEVHQRKVHFLHEDFEEPQRIKSELEKAVGSRITDYQCNIKTKHGQIVPILLTANWLYDNHGNHVGSVGFFEDRRLSERLALLVRVSRDLAQAESLNSGLKLLAQMMTEVFPQAFCRILLYDEQHEVLKVAAAASRLGDWRPGEGQAFYPVEYAGLPEVLQHGRIVRVRSDEPIGQQNLRRLRDKLVLPAPITSLLLVPLKRDERLIGLLDLGELASDAPSQMNKENRHLVQTLAAQVTLLIERWQLAEADRRRVEQTELLYQLSHFVQEANDETSVLQATLTGVTASYGLGFNRALVLLFDESGERLSGSAGIGQTDAKAAMQIWENLSKATLLDFQDYLNDLRAKRYPNTEFSELARQLTLTTSDPDCQWLFQAVQHQQPVLLQASECDRLPAGLREGFQFTSQLAFVPLVAQDKAIGLLLADNQFNRVPIHENDLKLLQSYANTAARALVNMRLLQRFYSTGARFDPAQSADALQTHLVSEIKAASGAACVVLIEADAQGGLRKRVASPDNYFALMWHEPRQQGLSRKVFASGKAEVISDIEPQRTRLHPLTPLRTKSMACLPLSLPARCMGVVWLHYDHPHQFTDFEIGVWQLFVNHLAGAYERAQRMGRMERTRELYEHLSEVSGTEPIVERLVEQAHDFFRADLALFWLYDQQKDAFQKAVQAGTTSLTDSNPPDLATQQAAPGKQALRFGVQMYDDITADEARQVLDAQTLRWLAQFQARSLLMLALEHDGVPLGVLATIYQQPQQFGASQQRAAEDFAHCVAGPLRNARLFDQTHRTNEALKTIALAAKQEDHPAALKNIVQEIRRATEADAVVLWEYDDAREKLLPPAVMDNVRFPQRVNSADEETDYELIYRVIAKGEPLMIPKTQNDERHRRARFVQDEQIETCIALPLRLKTEQCLGVLFINYRRPHRFSERNIEQAKTLADQVALALHVARTRRSQAYLQLIYEAGEDLTRSFSARPNELLATLLEKSVEAMQRIKHSGDLVGTIQLYHPATQELEFSSVYPHEKLDLFVERLGKRWSINVTRPNVIGVTGQAIHERRAQLVADVGKVPHYIPFYPATKSELVVPLLKDNQSEPLGSINFESPHLSGFDDEDLDMAQRLANFAVAILTGEDLRERLETSMAMSLMGIADSTWGHEKQTTIRAINWMARRCLAELDQGLSPAALRERLERIENASQSILQQQIPAAPLSGAAREPLVFFKLLNERVQALCKWKYPHVEFHVTEHSDRQAIVEANPDWLKWAIDILVDNAAKQLEHCAVRQLRLDVQRRQGRIEAALHDTGPGVPVALRPKLGRTRIEKPDGGSGGQGLGLLYARLILRSYDGELFWNHDEPVGTTAILSLPARERQD